MFLLISLNEKNTAGSEVLRQAASDVSPGRGGGRGEALSCTTDHKGEAEW